jgi:hypothetical protein
MPDDVRPGGDERTHGGSPVNADTHYEHKDAPLNPVVWFAIIFVIAAVGAHVVLYGTLKWMDRLQVEEELRQRPPLPAAVRDYRPHFPAQLQVIQEKHIAPALQTADILDMKDQRQAEDKVLNTFGWVDVAKGTVRIPIEEALGMIADPKTAAAHHVTAKVPEAEGGK